MDNHVQSAVITACFRPDILPNAVKQAIFNRVVIAFIPGNCSQGTAYSEPSFRAR